LGADTERFFQDFPPDWADQLRQVVREELENHLLHCRFSTVTEEQAQEAGHLLGMVEDIGEGRVAGGIESIRANHKWLKRQRERSEKLSTALAFAILSSLVGAAFFALWTGVKKLLGTE